MSAIAEQLDAKLKELDASAATLLEKLVREALDLVDLQNGVGRTARLPDDFFTRVAQEFGGGPLERPPQGEFEQRSAW